MPDINELISLKYLVGSLLVIPAVVGFLLIYAAMNPVEEGSGKNGLQSKQDSAAVHRCGPEAV